MRYRLESLDPATGVRERTGLSASSDAQALDQMEAARWRRESAGERRSWIVVSALDDGRERCDVLNADTAEDAARIASFGAGVVEVVSVEPRAPHP